MTTEQAEPQFLDAVRDAVQEAIDQVAEDYGEDLGFYEFKMDVAVLSADGNTVLSRRTLIDTHDGFCAYCGKRTYNYDHASLRHICAACENARGQTSSEAR